MGADGPSALVAAVSWIEGTLLGTLATSIAVVAVASVGFMMLTGHVDYRRGMTVIAGCFVLFGATSIAAGLRALASTQVAAAPVSAPAMARAPSAAPEPRPAQYDPYAGASVPTR